jgi:hypothetical protein
MPSRAQPQQQSTRSPHGPLAIPCENCHTSAGWRPIRPVPEFDHNKTKYPLRGMHEKVQCTQCHIKPVFTDVGKNCQDCHADIHRRKMGTNCAQCHTVLGWQIATQQIKDHQNRFPLFGAHAAVPCEQCHKSAAVGQYEGLSTACASCHLRDFQKATNPNHASAGFSTTCNLCHSTDSWLQVKFDHSATGFPLTNGHANVPCQSCHINNNYNLQIAPTDCGNSGCHLTTWRQTTTPVHSSAGPAFAVANCANCHTTKGWDGASFDHTATGFALTGTHASPTPTPCSACHVSNNYSLNSSDCMGCHLSAWNSTPTFGGSVPDHVKANFPSSASACATCHPITKWADGKFDHNAFGFPLTNSHALVANGGKVPACTSCHINNNYSLSIAPTDCGNSGCHLTTWQQTTNPNHPAAGSAFAAANCSTCHNTISWTRAIFDHATTGFALMGTHASPVPTPCASCHMNNVYTLNSNDCMGCHLPAWNSTPTFGGNVPDHIKSGFPSTASACTTCHPITKWADGKFDHSATGWPLTGFHLTSTTCAQCHINGNYNLTTANTDCYGCHVAAWQSTATLGGAVPNHIAANYPTTCASCHNTTSWLGATFNHTFFNIPHHGSVCSDCHLVSTNYATFSCINCHTNPFHTQAQTDPRHSGVGGYVYGPTTCYNCHK